jgi:hypothetical protein
VRRPLLLARLALSPSQAENHRWAKLRDQKMDFNKVFQKQKAVQK